VRLDVVILAEDGCSNHPANRYVRLSGRLAYALTVFPVSLGLDLIGVRMQPFPLQYNVSGGTNGHVERAWSVLGKLWRISAYVPVWSEWPIPLAFLQTSECLLSSNYAFGLPPSLCSVHSLSINAHHRVSKLHYPPRPVESYPALANHATPPLRHRTAWLNELDVLIERKDAVNGCPYVCRVRTPETVRNFS